MLYALKAPMLASQLDINLVIASPAYMVVMPLMSMLDDDIYFSLVMTQTVLI